MSNEKNLPYAVVCGGVNIDIGAHSFARRTRTPARSS